MSTKLNEFQNATVGMTVGVIEVLCLQPFNYCKNMIQQGQPLTADPRKLYRGVGANAVNMGSCTMIQFAVGGSLKKAVLGGENRQLKPLEEMGTGISAGVVSALVGSPLELIMIQQQRKGEHRRDVQDHCDAQQLPAGIRRCGRAGGIVDVRLPLHPPDCAPEPPRNVPRHVRQRRQGEDPGGVTGGTVRVLPDAAVRHGQDVHAGGHRAGDVRELYGDGEGAGEGRNHGVLPRGDISVREDGVRGVHDGLLAGSGGATVVSRCLQIEKPSSCVESVRCR